MKINYSVNTNGTYLIGYFIATYKELETAFGTPEDCDEYKVSGEWIFEADNGTVFTVYDWKSTNLYDSYYPTVEQFRNSDDLYEFHIGGNNTSKQELYNFIVFLREKLHRTVEYKQLP